MWFSSSLIAALLFQREHCVSAFLSSSTDRITRGTSRVHASTNDALLSGSSNHVGAAVPPAQERNKRRQDKLEYEEREIPTTVPKQPKVMENVSADEFSGDTVVTLPPKNENGAQINGNQRRTSHSSRRPQQPRNTKQPQQSNKERKAYEPWRAGYNVSTQTQARIKQAGNKKRFSNIERATAVLQTLLNTPPQKCNEANIVCALTLSAKAMLPSTPITSKFRHMLMETLDVLRHLVREERLNARQLCNAVWAIAKHYNRDHTILPPAPETTAMSTEDMIGVAEAWILQAESDDTPEKRVKETVDMIAMQLTNILDDEDRKNPKVGELSMACWAYGVLQPRRRPPGWAVPPQMGRIPHSKKKTQQQQRNVEFITFEQWTLDDSDEFRLGSPEDCIDCFFDAVGEALCQQQTDDRDDEWSFGEPLMEQCSWSEIANVAWAYASHGYCHTPSSEAAMRGLAHEATIRLHGNDQHVQPRDIAQLVWAVGTLQADNFRLADDLVGLIDAVNCHWGLERTNGDTKLSIERPFHQWSCPDLVQLAISSAHGRIDNRPLLRAVYEESLHRLREDKHESMAYSQRRNFRPWEISILLWAQARLYLRESEGQVFEEFASEAASWLAQPIDDAETLEDMGIEAQEQANLAWSLTVLEQYHSKDATRLLKAIFQEASSSSEERHVIQLEHAHQLWQALYILEEDCPSAVQDVPQWFRDFLQEKWTLEKSRRKKSSARHRSLSDTLNLMNVAHFNEHDEDIDVAIVLREGASWTHQARRDGSNGKSRLKVAVEFDGPNHFTRETGDKNGSDKPRALGHTVLKYRLLKREGWTVVRVPFYEFDKIPFWASQERQRYLQRLLKTHANLRFSTVDVSEYKAPVPDRQSRFD